MKSTKRNCLRGLFIVSDDKHESAIDVQDLYINKCQIYKVYTPTEKSICTIYQDKPFVHKIKIVLNLIKWLF